MEHGGLVVSEENNSNNNISNIFLPFLTSSGAEGSNFETDKDYYDEQDGHSIKMNIPDLLITIAYFSIPLQLLFSLHLYPRFAQMHVKYVVLIVLFALFILLCGTGHLLRCLGHRDTELFIAVNYLTAGVSLITALCLLPLTPNVLGDLDKSLEDFVRVNHEKLVSNEAKNKLFTFMAFLCHEIRNPLFAITSTASFLADTEMTEEQEIGVGSIFDSALLMLRIVNDVLDLSKIDEGKMELEERDFDLHELLENLEYNMRMQVAQRTKSKVALNFTVEPEVPNIVKGDSTRMLQIIYNLLGNSTKFTSEGFIDVDIGICQNANEAEQFDIEQPSSGTFASGNPTTTTTSATKTRKGQFSLALLNALDEATKLTDRSASNNEVVLLKIAVSDTGIGIAPDRIKTIFEPYTQSKLSDYREHGGTGLGLSIVSSLIKLMDGSISVTSKEGEGTRFIVHIPVQVSNDQGQIVQEKTDMTDPFLTCKRLPVYQKGQTHEDLPSGIPMTSTVCSNCTRLHHNDTGIQFYDDIEEDRCQCNNVIDMPSTHTTTTAGGSSRSVLSTPEHPPQQGQDQDQEEHKQQLQEQQQQQKQEHKQLQQQTSSFHKAKEQQPHPSPEKKVFKRKKKQQLPSFALPSRSNVVLVVDDNDINRKIIGKMLSMYNIEYEEAVNGAEAVETIKASCNLTGNPNAPNFALVFMDLSMPVMDGYEATEHIRQLENDENKMSKKNVHIPIVALTANALTQERVRALKAGADEFHTKPILRNDLHAICTRYLVQSVSTSSTDESSSNISSLASMMMGGNDSRSNITSALLNTALPSLSSPPSPKTNFTVDLMDVV